MKLNELTITEEKSFNVIDKLILQDKNKEQVAVLKRYNRGFTLVELSERLNNETMLEVDKVIAHYTDKALLDAPDYDVQYWLSQSFSSLSNIKEKLPFDKTTALEYMASHLFAVQINDLAIELAVKKKRVLVITDHYIDPEFVMEVMQVSAGYMSIVSTAYQFDSLPWKDSEHFELASDKLVYSFNVIIKSFRDSYNWFAYFDRRMVILDNITFLEVSIDLYSSDLGLGNYSLITDFNDKMLESTMELALPFGAHFDASEYKSPQKALMELLTETKTFADVLKINLYDFLPDEIFIDGTKRNPLMGNYALTYEYDQIKLSYYGSPYRLVLDFGIESFFPILVIESSNNEDGDLVHYIAITPRMAHGLDVKDQISLVLTEFIRNEELWKFKDTDTFSVTGKKGSETFNRELIDLITRIYTGMYADVPEDEDFKPEITVVDDKVIIKGQKLEDEFVITLVEEKQEEPIALSRLVSKMH